MTENDYCSNYGPHVQGKGKLEPCSDIGIHPIIETGLNTQVKVEPCYEYRQDTLLSRWKEDRVIDCDDVGIEDQSIDASHSNSQITE